MKTINLKFNENIIVDTTNDIGKDIPPPTLKDIAIILNEMCGQGVSWNLAYELSRKTGFSYVKLVRALGNIIKEYINLSDLEAQEKFINSPIPSKRYFRGKKNDS